MAIKMKELPETERPYEKLEKYGEKILTNAELLAIIIKTGFKEETSLGVAHKLLNLNEYDDKTNLNYLRELSLTELKKIKGIGRVKAIQLKAVCELANRMNYATTYIPKKILYPKHVAKLLMDQMRYEKQEVLKLVLLDNKSNLIKVKDISFGSSGNTRTTIKTILNEAIRMEASKIILVHNHPSGDPTPSQDDLEFTEQVKKAASIISIILADHIIIGKDKYLSIFTKYKEFTSD